jgi:hypothetical protein
MRFETEGTVEPHAVVKDFDPFNDGGFGFGSGGKLTAMHQLPFEAAPKDFYSDGVPGRLMLG